jgi:hypothetical protein
MTKRGLTIGYWITTAFFLLPMAGSAIPELFTGGPEATAASIVRLGFPLYLLRILGFAKLLGAVAILSNRSRRLKEWAYAGYTFDLLGAAASHVLAGDAAHSGIPIVVLGFVAGSYVFWRRADAADSATGAAPALP